MQVLFNALSSDVRGVDLKFNIVQVIYNKFLTISKLIILPVFLFLTMIVLFIVSKIERLIFKNSLKNFF